MTSCIDGLWTVHYQGWNGDAAGGVAAFMNGRVVGGDSGHMLHGSIDIQGSSLGAYFRVQSVASNIPNALGGRTYIEFHLKGKLEDHGRRICATVESSLTPSLIAAPVELRKKVGFVNNQTLLLPRKSQIHLIHAAKSDVPPGRFGGFWTIEVETAQGIGSGVLLLAQNLVLGGNSNYTFIGTSQIEEDNIKIRLLMANFMAGGPNLLGYFGDGALDILGSLQRDSQVRGTAAVVHLPDLQGHCRLKRKVSLSHYSTE